MTTSDELTKVAEYISAHYDAHESSAHLLANHYLSTHADGERVIDAMWLAERFKELGGTYFVQRYDASGIEIESINSGKRWAVFAVNEKRCLLRYVTTRRQLISLLSALGVEVKS